MLFDDTAFLICLALILRILETNLFQMGILGIHVRRVARTFTLAVNADHEMVGATDVFPFEPPIVEAFASGCGIWVTGHSGNVVYVGEEHVGTFVDSQFGISVVVDRLDTFVKDFRCAPGTELGWWAECGPLDVDWTADKSVLYSPNALPVNADDSAGVHDLSGEKEREEE